MATKVSAKLPKQELMLESLANKYRPKTLEDLVGQNHIAAEIVGMLNRKRFPNTILLSGESGCGKTTIARLLAKYILCKSPDSKTHAPCGECSSCSYGDHHPDLDEINLGDTRGVDDIRSIIQGSSSMPSIGDKRIYILDECFPADTEVLLAEGRHTTIERLVNSTKDLEVVSYNDKTNVQELKRITNRWEKIAEDSSMVRVVTSEGYQDCTANHSWWSLTRKRMIRADELQEGERLLAFASRQRDQIEEFCVKQVKSLHNRPTKVYDIEVESNHNFFIRPKGSKHWVLVSNCHAMTSIAATALLKPLEDSPARTLWILATTNPEKLPTTILGRCHKFTLNMIPPQTLVNRLARVSKREGIDMKTVEGGAEILKLIANLSNGRMRDGLSLLEKALAVLSSSTDVDIKTVMGEVLKTTDSDLDRDASTLIAASMSNDLKVMVKTIRSTQSVRGLISKCRWLLQFLLDDACSIAKYTPYTAKLFKSEASKKNITVSLSQVVQLQYIVLEVETKCNTISVDEGVILLSVLGDWMTKQKSKSVS